jgi:hypothetical protein
MCRNTGYRFLAFENIHLYVRSCPAPFELVVARGQLLALDGDAFREMDRLLAGVSRKGAGGQHQRAADQQSEELCDFHVQLPFIFSGHWARERTLRPAERFDLVFPFVRWRRPLAVRLGDAANFVLYAENNFMVESGEISFLVGRYITGGMPNVVASKGAPYDSSATIKGR